MTEARADLFSLVGLVDWLCITTNGVLSGHKAVMGRGTALTAKTMWPGIEYELAEQLSRYGNIPRPIGWADKLGYVRQGKCVFDPHVTCLWSFPTKHHWRNGSDPELIKISAKWLMKHAGDRDIEIALPRPGCSNGGLEWDYVRKLISPILDDRFTVVTNE